MITDIKKIIIPVILGLSSCSYPTYLPKIANLGEDRFGSYIIISQSQSKTIRGELISVENRCINVLVDSTIQGESTKYKKMLCIDPLRIDKYTVYYARPPSYEAFIPILSLATISHGYYFIISLPINLITTIAITAGAHRAASYRMNAINTDQLRMFSRFPQGIPPGIDIASIK